MFERSKILAAAISLFAAASLSACGGETKADVSVSVDESSSYCQQDSILSNIDFVVVLRNTGADDATGVSVTPVRYYDDGSRNGSAMDTAYDVTVPGNGTQRVWGQYDVDRDHVIVGCAVRINAGEEIEIRARTS